VSPAGTRRPRILWSDDNADMRDYVRRLLEDRYEVTAVGDGAAALAAAQANPPDLVLSDVMMPGLNGFELMRALRADQRTRTVPMILLSARAGEDSAVEGLDAGADDYLAKPFSARELLARVRTHLAMARVRRSWAAELERANKELEAFSYSVSHDLRAPLRAIDGFSRTLLATHLTVLDDDGKYCLERVRAAAARMSSLIDDLLALSKITRSPLRLQPTDLAAIAHGVVDELRARDPGRAVDVEIDPDLRAECDARFLTVVLENLLDNAWKFTAKRADAIVRVGKRLGDDKTVFFVQDNGAGFDMRYSGMLFKPFQRLHTIAEFDGTGVGLATVQRVISRHRGRIWAESTPGQGATFFFTLGGSR
jgi:signal transduction histidine kinase